MSSVSQKPNSARTERSRPVLIAVIGAVAVVLAAIVTGLFTILEKEDTPTSSGPTASPPLPTTTSATLLTPTPTPTFDHPVDLVVGGLADDGSLAVTARVHQVPPPGRYYWLVLQLDGVDPKNLHSEFYGRTAIISKPGEQRMRLSFAEADPELPRTLTVYAVSKAAADYLQRDADSHGQTATTDQRVNPPCGDCAVSKAIRIKIR